MTYKLCIELQYTPNQVYDMCLKDFNGLLRVLSEGLHKPVYQFELDNLKKLKESYENKQ
jgi:hypothetical protein